MTSESANTAEAIAETRLRVVRYFSDLCSELVPASVRTEHVEMVRALEAKTDAELSDLGLLRDEIVEHVYREARFL